MSANAIAISRQLTESGLTQSAANAIAEVVVDHADESHATKADIANLRAEFKTEIAELRTEVKGLAAMVKLLVILMGGLYAGIAAYFLQHLGG